MFLTWDQVILVKDQSKRRQGDAVVYIRNGNIREGRNVSEQTLWPAFDEAMSAERTQAGMTRYGTIYQDASEAWCVVPDTWDENDALRAKLWV